MKSRMAIVLGLLAMALALDAPPALAAPSLGVQVKNDANEVQLVTVRAGGGKFVLSFGSGGPGVSETAEIPATAGAGEVQAALNALANIATGGGSVSVSGGPGDPTGKDPYLVTFDGGPLYNADVPQLGAASGAVSPLSGGAATVSVSTFHKAGVFHSDERMVYLVSVSNTGTEPTLGPITLKLSLPGGTETQAYKTEGSGWGSCAKEPPDGGDPAAVTCTRSDSLVAGASYPTLTVTVALGADAPDLAKATATVFGGGAPFPASATDEVVLGPFLEFGIEDFDGSILQEDRSEYRKAGGHPFQIEGTFSFVRKRNLTGGGGLLQGDYTPIGHAKHVIVDVPRGFVGNAQALPALCPTTEDVLGALGFSTCPPESMVGGIDLRISSLSVLGAPIYAIEPEYGTAAQFAFKDPLNNIYTFAPRLRADDGYAISFESAPTPSVDILAAVPRLCGFGAKKGIGSTGERFDGCKTAAEAIADNPDAKPLTTMPTRCENSGPVATLRVDAWEDPATLRPDGAPDLSDPRWKAKAFENPTVEECDQVKFEPTVSIQPTSSRADSASGLDIDVEMPTDGLEDPNGVAQANLRRTRVTFPEGMAVNPTAGQGLGACSAAQVKLGTNEPISCPDASKIGTVEIDTPLIADPLEGGVYVARQGEVDGALIGFYLVFDSEKNGILIKVPATVDPDPGSGRLVATVNGIPEAPFSAVRMHFPQGPRSTLLTPPRCGAYSIDAEMTPWTGGAPVTESSSFTVSSGPNGGPCPTGALEAKLNAGVTDSTAGKTSPFVLRLTREDGSQRFSALGVRTPPGLTGYLKGIPYCPQATLDAISGAPGTAQAQIDNPSCPAASQIGVASAAAGAGSNPLFVDTGKVYLAPPYKGAPLSIAVVAPAVAGPLDLGSVVVQNAVRVDPQTAQISVASDPIPTILHGLLLDVREIRVALNRPGFTLNPTSCRPMSVEADVTGADGGAASLSSYFQVGGCRALGFKPRVKLRLFGKTNRGAYQGVRAVVRPRPGDSNISRTVVRFPKSAFVAQEHIRTVCTRVQFAAEACPKGSIYGRAVAHSPLVDYPLEGNVYLRSSDNTLPDAVADLRGPAHQPVRIEVAIRNDSVKGALRNTVQAVPDAPVSWFRLQLRGGNKGLIVNSRNICGPNRARVAMGAHNGRRSVQRVNVFNRRCKKQRRAKRQAKLRRTARRAAAQRQNGRIRGR